MHSCTAQLRCRLPAPAAGDTIYNLSRFNELEAGEDDRPEHPPVLLRAEVLWNPFDDLQPRVDRWAAVGSNGCTLFVVAVAWVRFGLLDNMQPSVDRWAVLVWLGWPA